MSIATETVQSALFNAYDRHEQLGEVGLETVQSNQFGDTALRGDVECEEAVLDTVRSAGLQTQVYSEEHGLVKIGAGDGIPEFTGMLDGIDGSSLYAKQRNIGHYGTMFALFEGDDPTYDDYVASGIAQHATGRILLAAKGEGVRVIHLPGNAPTGTHARKTESLDPDNATIYVDNPPNASNYPALKDYFDSNRTNFAEPFTVNGFNPLWLGASVAYYAGVVLGEADAVGESTRKGNLEIGVAYGLITEAGGTMTTLDGQDIGPQRLRSFGQDEHVPILTASNPTVAEQLLKIINER